MTEPIAEYGSEVGVCGSPDGTTWEKILTVGGRLQIDVESTGNPSNLDIAISELRDAICSDAPFGYNLADLYSKLGDISDDLAQKLRTDDINLDAAKDLQVDVKTAPTTAVTVADAADVVAGAVADAAVAAGAVGTLSAKLRRLTTDLDALLTELKLKADLTETQPVSVTSMPTTTVQASGGDKILSFESIVEEAVFDEDLDAGEVVLSGTAVPSGKVWDITLVSAMYFGTPPSVFQVYVQGLAGGVVVISHSSPVANVWYTWSGHAYLQAGDTMSIYAGTCTLHDRMYMRYAGVQMDAPG